MKKNSFFTSLPFKLLVGVVLGIIAGLILSSTDSSSVTMAILNIVVTLKYVLGQLINFCVPLIIIGFIAPSITKLGNSASRMLGVALVIAYVSSIGAALFSVAAGYTLIPHLSIVTNVEGLKELPEVVFELSIPQIMSVMSALVFSIMVGLAATWNKAKLITGLLDEFQKIVLSIVSKIIIPILPFFIGLTFCGLAYEGSITKIHGKLYATTVLHTLLQSEPCPLLPLSPLHYSVQARQSRFVKIWCSSVFRFLPTSICAVPF